MYLRFILDGEIHIQSRLKHSLALALLVAIFTWLIVGNIYSARPIGPIGTFVFVVMASVPVLFGLTVILKPNRLILYSDRIALSAGYEGKERVYYWKDISEIKAVTGRFTYGINLKFDDPLKYSASSILIAGFWDISRPEMVDRMNARLSAE